MIDAASTYCLSTEFNFNIRPSDYEQIFESRMPDQDSRFYWDVAATILNDIVARDGELHPSQFYYVATVYPERVTANEAAGKWEAVSEDAKQRWAWAAASACDLAAQACGIRPHLSPVQRNR